MLARVLAGAAHAHGRRKRTHGARRDPGPAASTGAASIHGVVTSTEGAVYEGARVVLERSGQALHSGNRRPIATAHSALRVFRRERSSSRSLARIPDARDQRRAAGGRGFDARTIALPVAARPTRLRCRPSRRWRSRRSNSTWKRSSGCWACFRTITSATIHNAEPLTTRQKYQLAWRTSIDPVTWADDGRRRGHGAGQQHLCGIRPGRAGIWQAIWRELCRWLLRIR